MKLRPYQSDATEQCLKHLVDHTSTICVMATGLGKTVVISAVGQQFSEFGKVLVIAHRAELIRQNADTIETFTGERCDIEMASERAGDPFGLVAASRFISSSVQTQTSRSECPACFSEGCDQCIRGRRYRFQKFDPMDFSLVVIDEGHHGTAKSYRLVKEWYGRNPNCKFLYLTATPKRGDGVGMGNVCDSVAYQMGILEGIHGGWLVPIRAKYVHVDGLDISRVKKKSTGDLSDGELEKAMIGDGTPLIQVASAIAKEKRRWIVFTVGKEHSARMTDALRAVGMNAESITEDTPPEERKAYKGMLQRGQLDALVGVDVLTEGFDVKEVTGVACVRPTLSVGTLTQMVGRGTRPLAGVVDGPETPEARMEAIATSGKPDCLVLDFVGNSGRHKLASVFDVLGGDGLPHDVAMARKRAITKGKEFDPLEAVEKAKRDREKREAELERKRVQRIAECHQYEEKEVDLFGSNQVPVAKPASRGTKATEKQVKLLVALGYGVNFSQGSSKRQAGRLIDDATKRGIKPDWTKLRLLPRQAPQQPQRVASGSSEPSMAEIFEALR